jgi:hypothetical protein
MVVIMVLRRLAVVGTSAAMIVGLAVTPAYAAQACTTLWTSDGSGRISICKTWTRHSDGNKHYGEFWGTLHGRNVMLQAWFDGRQENIAGTGNSSQKSFNRPYQRINRLQFRACKRSQSCTTQWW